MERKAAYGSGVWQPPRETQRGVYEEVEGLAQVETDYMRAMDEPN
jgi:hypothetical protein